MAITSASHSRSLLVAAAALIAWTQGCTSYRPTSQSSLAPNAHVRLRVRDSVPFHVLPQSQMDASLGGACGMTLVEGRVSHTRGDTAFLLPVRRMVRATEEGDSACAFPRGTMLAFPGGQLPAPAVAVRRFSAWRTVFLTVGTLYVTLAALVGYTCSTQRDC